MAGGDRHRPEAAVPPVTIRWLPEAVADLERLIDFLGEHNPDAASRAARAILDGADLLLTAPNLGRPMPDKTGRRELVIPFAAGAYVLRYRLEGERTVVIIRIWHSRQERD